MQDVLFFSVDGLPGFKEAIQAVYPQAQIQRCVVHMLQNSFNYINYNHLKKFASDFKAVYKALTESAALSELEGNKDESVFPSDSALEKILYLASKNAAKKWTQRYRNWDQILSQLIILYDERLT